MELFYAINIGGIIFIMSHQSRGTQLITFYIYIIMLFIFLSKI